jgi:hypothetical protein
MEQWTDKQQVAASTSAAMAAQMPFLALLQGAGVVVEGAETEEQQQYEHEHDGRKRQAFARAVSKLDLLESCLTQAVDPAAEACAPVASRTTERRRKRPRTRARAAPPPEKRSKPEEAESQRMTHIAVERNRRRLMNDHLASLRSLIPSRYIPRVSHAMQSPCMHAAFRLDLTTQRLHAMQCNAGRPGDGGGRCDRLREAAGAAAGGAAGGRGRAARQQCRVGRRRVPRVPAVRELLGLARRRRARRGRGGDGRGGRARARARRGEAVARPARARRRRAGGPPPRGLAPRRHLRRA